MTPFDSCQFRTCTYPDLTPQVLSTSCIFQLLLSVFVLESQTAGGSALDIHRICRQDDGPATVDAKPQPVGLSCCFGLNVLLPCSRNHFSEHPDPLPRCVSFLRSVTSRLSQDFARIQTSIASFQNVLFSLVSAQQQNGNDNRIPASSLSSTDEDSSASASISASMAVPESHQHSSLVLTIGSDEGGLLLHRRQLELGLGSSAAIGNGGGGAGDSSSLPIEDAGHAQSLGGVAGAADGIDRGHRHDGSNHGSLVVEAGGLALERAAHDHGAPAMTNLSLPALPTGDESQDTLGTLMSPPLLRSFKTMLHLGLILFCRTRVFSVRSLSGRSRPICVR